jgi:HAD superfamily hydrolase (TIGR01509 family)
MIAFHRHPELREIGYDHASMIEVILWDNDGVLVDTEELYFRATREILEREGAILSREQFIEYLMRRGQSVWEVMLPGKSAQAITELRRERGALYSNLLKTEPTAMPHAREVVAALSSKYKMAIVTSSHREHFEIAHRNSGMLQMFAMIVAREDYVNSKPSPEPYLTALARLGLPADRCVTIEDSERGVTSAIATGLRCIAIPRGLTADGDFSRATLVLKNITEVPAALALIDSSTTKDTE